MDIESLGLASSPPLAALLTAARWVLPGWSWAWVLPKSSEPGWRGGLVAAAHGVAFSFIASSVLGLALGSVGVLQAGAFHGGWIAFSAVGLACGRARPRPAPAKAGALIALLAAAFLLFGVRSEWRVGGRDPGIYFGEGIRLAREGTFSPAPRGLLAELPPDRMPFFTRNRFGFPEVLPVVPLDAAGRAERPFFFPVTAVTVAGLALDGGVEWASRQASLQAMLLALAGGAWLAAAGFGGWAVAAFVAAFFAQSVVCYHLGLTLSEFAEVFLVFALALWLRAPGRVATGLVALTCALGAANRLSFVMFGGLALALWAWEGGDATPRARRVARLAWAWLGMLAGAGLCQALAGPAMLRLDDQALELLVAGLLLACGGLAVASLSLFDSLRQRIGVPSLVLLSIPVLFALGAFREGGLPRMGLALSGTWGFVGAPVLLAGGLGLILGLRALREGNALWLPAYFTVAALLIFSRFEIATDFPWASRRYLLALTPALALGAAFGVERLRAWGGSPWGRIALLLAIAGLNHSLGHNYSTRGYRINCREYQGLASRMREIAAALPAGPVICDHFLWGTPLRMVHGADLIDGDLLRERGTLREGLDFLRARGPVHLLTSVPSGADWVDLAIREAVLVREWPAFTYRTMKSHAKVRRLEALEKTKVFRLYRFEALP